MKRSNSNSKNPIEKECSTRKKRLKDTFEASIHSSAKAQKITLDIIEGKINNIENIKKEIRYITPEQYKDIEEERYLDNICGYLLCGNKIENKFSQENIIRGNNVYSIAERKKFCSNKCFEASQIILHQVPSTPLYLREFDDDIQNFTLKIPNRENLKGKHGNKVNIRGSCFINEDEIDLEALSSEEEKCDAENDDFDVKPCTKVSFDEETTIYQEDSSLQINKDFDQLKLDERNDIKNSNPGRKMNKELKHKDTKEFIFEVEKTMREWMNFESLRIILGDDYVRGMLEHLGKNWEDYDTTAGLRLGIESKSKYVTLCKKLDRQELEEELDAQNMSCLDRSDAFSRPAKPTPNYDQLQRDVDNQSFKVKSFFEGDFEYPEQHQNDELSTIAEEGETRPKTADSEGSKFKRSKNSKKKEIDLDGVTLPIIDTYDQITWRRQIFFEKITKSFSVLCCDLGLNEGKLRPTLKPLIASFDLSSHNICLETAQWRLTSLVLLKMLSVRYPVVAGAMSCEEGKSYIGEFLASVDLDPSYLDRLLAFLTEIVYLLSKYHLQYPAPPPINGENNCTDAINNEQISNATKSDNNEQISNATKSDNNEQISNATKSDNNEQISNATKSDNNEQISNATKSDNNVKVEKDTEEPNDRYLNKKDNYENQSSDGVEEAKFVDCRNEVLDQSSSCDTIERISTKLEELD